MSLRRLVHENFWLKLFSIILAIGLWFIIRPSIDDDPSLPRISVPVTDPVLRKAVELPVYVLTDPADAQIFQIWPETVAVTLTGEAVVLEKFRSRDFKAYLDLTESRIPRTNHEVRLHVPNGVTVLEVLPRAVDIERISP